MIHHPWYIRSQIKRTHTHVHDPPSILQAKQADLAEVMGRLALLEDQLARSVADKARLEGEVELCTQKLDRAEKLISVRWPISVYVKGGEGGGAGMACRQTDNNTNKPAG